MGTSEAPSEARRRTGRASTSGALNGETEMASVQDAAAERGEAEKPEEEEKLIEQADPKQQRVPVAKEKAEAQPAPHAEPKSDLTGEYGNIAILLLLYTLQGIPLGLCGVFPMILRDQKVSISAIGTFSFSFYPFSGKLLWAPIVDSVYIPSVGRRKTWMVPAQLIIGFMFLFLSTCLDQLLYVDEPAVLTLTAIFFVLIFFAATQDIAVDGWALTMLRKENVNYAATCNSVGQTLGYSISYTGLLALKSWEIVTVASFMYYCGLIFIVVTVAVAALKKESPVPPEDEPGDVVTSYKQMLAIAKLRTVRSTVIFCCLWKASFGLDSSIPIKFQDKGISKEHVAYLTSALGVVGIFLPLCVTRYTSGSAPLDVALRAYPVKVMLVLVSLLLIFFFPSSLEPSPWGFYFLLVLTALAQTIVSQCMFVSLMAFFARVSDPALGGTYMTLLNTVANIGGMWPGTLAMKLVDPLTCSLEAGHWCPAGSVDGFYVVGCMCFAAGVCWQLLGSAQANRLQRMKLEDWKVR